MSNDNNVIGGSEPGPVGLRRKEDIGDVVDQGTVLLPSRTIEIHKPVELDFSGLMGCYAHPGTRAPDDIGYIFPDPESLPKPNYD